MRLTDKEIRKIYNDISYNKYGKKYSKISDEEANEVIKYGRRVINQSEKTNKEFENKQYSGLGLFRRFG